jgi:hypothetical protein
MRSEAVGHGDVKARWTISSHRAVERYVSVMNYERAHRRSSSLPSRTLAATFALFAIASVSACEEGDEATDSEPLASTGPGSSMSSSPGASSPAPNSTPPGAGGAPSGDGEPEPGPNEPEQTGGSGPVPPPGSGGADTGGEGGAGNGDDDIDPAPGNGPGGTPNEPEPSIDPSDAGSGITGGTSSSDASTPTEDGGSTDSPGGCAGRDFVLCEDFEDTDVGDIPEDWYRLGEEVAVADDEARGGERSLKLGAIPSWERRIGHDASELGSAHWGRIHYKMQLPVPDQFVHSTMVAFSGDGPMYGPSEYRFIDTVKQAIDTPDVGSRHNFLFNVQPENSGEFGRETSYDWTFDDQWHCAEYHVDSANQSYAFYLDGNEELSFEDGAGNYEDTDLPDSFEEIRVGWNNYQDASPGFTVWMDDIAFGLERIGCD